MVYTVEGGTAQLTELLDLLRDSEEVVIRRDGKVVAKLTRAAEQPRKVQLGAMKGEFTYTEGWDKPLTDEESEAFWEGRW